MTETNSQFSKKNGIFILACELASIPSTARQASKYRNARGLAFTCRRMAIDKSKETVGPTEVKETPLGEGITLQEADVKQ